MEFQACNSRTAMSTPVQKPPADPSPIQALGRRVARDVTGRDLGVETGSFQWRPGPAAVRAPPKARGPGGPGANQTKTPHPSLIQGFSRRVAGGLTGGTGGVGGAGGAPAQPDGERH